MSFDFRRGDVDFAESVPGFYEAPSNFRHSALVPKALHQHTRAPTKRMVVIQPKAKTKTKAKAKIGTWVREALDAPLLGTFRDLVEQIDFKYGPQSNLQRLLFSEEYMAVIGMGPRVVPLLLEDLKSGNTPWFWALKAITREDVGSDVGAGDFRSLRDAWLVWGATKGLL